VKRLGPVSVLLSAALVAATVAACSKGKPDAEPPSATASAVASTDASPSATASASVAPSPSAAYLLEFSVDGAGPYQLGATLEALKTEAGLDEIVTGGTTCPQNTTARGKDTWKDIHLSFHPDGSLYLAVNRSTSIPTPSGAWLGSTLAQLKTIYAKVPGQELHRGTASAYLVTTVSGRGILFDLDASKKVIAMLAGEANFLKSGYISGTNFC
jgi:hypothetical protein